MNIARMSAEIIYTYGHKLIPRGWWLIGEKHVHVLSGCWCVCTHCVSGKCREVDSNVAREEVYKQIMGHMTPVFGKPTTQEVVVSGKTSKASYLNSAFVFIKPHANTKATQDYVRGVLQAKGLSIASEGTINGTEIDEKKLIDNHYYAIASKATILKPSALPVPADKFEAFFGTSWQSVRFIVLCSGPNLSDCVHLNDRCYHQCIIVNTYTHKYVELCYIISRS